MPDNVDLNEEEDAALSRVWEQRRAARAQRDQQDEGSVWEERSPPPPANQPTNPPDQSHA